MPDTDSNFRDVSGNVNIAQVGGDVYGDIVAGNKITITYLIDQARGKIDADPYKFLSAYEISDKDRFFGRTTAVDDIISRLPLNRAIIINGRSGAGKSSLIHAGLIPRLTEYNYHFLSFQDYADPLQQLYKHVAHNPIFRPFLDHTHSLCEFLKTITRQQDWHLVLIFDQFERFFLHVAPELQRQLIQELKSCFESDLTGEELDLIFALREEFYGRFVSEFEAAIPTFRNTTQRVDLHPLTRAEAREAIVRPLERISMKIGYNEDFVNTVLLPGLMGESSGGVEVDPPHLQIVCNQLYKKAKHDYADKLARGGVVEIDWQIYESLGETQGILDSYLDDFVDRAAQKSKDGRKVLHSMLKLMVETTGIRKFRSLQELQRGLPDVAPEQVAGYIQALQIERILETRQQDDVVRYSLSHEVMVEKVQSWSDKREFERKKAKEILEHGIAEWKITEALLNEKQVKHIRFWLDGEKLGTKEEQLLTQSQQAYEKRQRQMRRSRVMVSALTVFLLIAAGIIFWQYSSHKKLWQPVYADDSVLSLATATIDGTSPIYYAGTANRGLIWSLDGQSWKVSNTALPTVEIAIDGKLYTYVQGIMRLSVDVLNPRRIFAAVQDAGIYRNQDPAQPWEPINTDLPAEGLIIDLDVCGEHVFAVLADSSGSRLYASADSGEHWELANGRESFALPMVLTVSLAPGADQRYGNADDLVYVGTSNGIYSNVIQLPWHWEAMLPTEEPVMQIIPATDKHTAYYIATLNSRQAITNLWEWQPHKNTVSKWAALSGPFIALTRPSPPLASVGIFGLLANGEVIATTLEGNNISLGKLPGRGYDVLAVQRPKSQKITLLLAHDDGLFEYLGKVELRKK